MIRIVYRWEVAPENFDAFKETWNATTNRIHETVEGAFGSFLIRSIENDKEIITIAKWKSLESWKSFWGNAKPHEMEAMRKLGKRVTAEVFEEIEDQTK